MANEYFISNAKSHPIKLIKDIKAVRLPRYVQHAHILHR